LHEEDIKELLNSVKQGSLGIEDALKKLKNLPYEDLGYAMIDHHRTLRRGHPETIFCAGKTTEQIIGITHKMIKNNVNILGTRLSGDVFDAVKKEFPEAEYFKDARAFTIRNRKIEKTTAEILVITAGTSDIPVAEEAVVTAEILGNTVNKLYDAGASGIHRILSHRDKLEKASVVIVTAGMDGVLPTVVAGLIDKPVIAVPTSIGYGTGFSGLSALLTMLNSCASGITVVNIDNGYGAGYAASLINHLADKS
jgi:NCAIR mutase (PurE)-related protein